MDLRIFVEPQLGASYETQLGVARAAEEHGFDAFFRSDHYINFGNGSGEPGPTDSWVTLGALARETSTIRLGTLVTAVTFRHAGPLAISVAQVDAMSGGRVELGIGAAWNDTEHAAYAIPFPPTGERFELLEDTLAIVTGMWETPAGTTFSYTGKHLSVVDSPALPKPAQRPHPPIIIGGFGPKRTPRLVASYADEYNTPFMQAKDVPAMAATIDEACEAVGRDPSTVLRSSAVVICCAENDRDFARRAAAIGQEPDQLRQHAVAGTPAEVVDKLGAYADAGITRVYLQLLDQTDLDHVHLLGSEVLGRV
jgi:F420-dependent oxidoreductase-like protein